MYKKQVALRNLKRDPLKGPSRFGDVSSAKVPSSGLDNASFGRFLSDLDLDNISEDPGCDVKLPSRFRDIAPAKVSSSGLGANSFQKFLRNLDPDDISDDPGYDVKLPLNWTKE